MRKDCKQLKIWSKADARFEMVCSDVTSFPNGPCARSITYQLLDAVGSISANIAEGYGRGLPREFEQFLRYSRGSPAETDNWLYKAMKQKMITQTRYREYGEIFTQLERMIASFVYRLRQQSARKPPPAGL